MGSFDDVYCAYNSPDWPKYHGGWFIDDDIWKTKSVTFNLSLHQTRRSVALNRKFRGFALFFPRAGDFVVSQQRGGRRRNP
jgi:hypothetical protein